MIKEVFAFNYSRKRNFQDSEEWYFERHSALVRNLPHLAKYCSYRTLRIVKNNFIPSNPQFTRLEELWWPSKPLYKTAQLSPEMKRVREDLMDPELGSGMVDVKHAVLEKEINVMHPALSAVPETTMNELSGKPHIKSLWCFNYLDELPVPEAERWYLNHHTLLAARNFNLVRYVTYSPTLDLDVNHGFVRYTELCWRDAETMLNDFVSPRGTELMEDNKNEKGVWRSINKTSFMDYPHVIGHETVFI